MRREEEVVESQKGGEECGKSTKVTESMHGRGRERRRAGVGEGIGWREQEGGGEVPACQIGGNQNIKLVISEIADCCFPILLREEGVDG